jgi:tetratricopeptide (TPR) repeat protein
MSPQVGELLRAYQTSFGPMSDFQAVVCVDPSPLYMASVFEFGVEQFIAVDTWPEEVAALCRSIQEKLEDQNSAEYKTMELASAIRTADPVKIKTAKEAMGDLATYDFRAAYASGKASEASGNYDEAMDAYRSAGGMNKMYRPTNTSLGEACLITGKVDEAIAIFEKLDRSNPRDIDRKSSLASAFIEKGDFETAQKYAAEAEALDPKSSRIAEIKAQVLLGQGKVGDAFNLMDGMSNVGPFFAAKLNDLGIKLSQAGKGKSALALYQKAHKVVREDLKYKISLNAALACRRLQDYDMALKYVARCAKEYGSLYPKLAKIRETLLKEKAAVDADSKTPQAG